MMLVNLFIGRLADKASDWKSAIVILALIAGAVPVGLFFVSGFWGILLIWTLCVVPAFSLTPITDTATLRMTLRNGTDFAFVRAWGTVGYMVTTLVAGPVIAIFGDGGVPAAVPRVLGGARAVLAAAAAVPGRSRRRGEGAGGADGQAPARGAEAVVRAADPGACDAPVGSRGDQRLRGAALEAAGHPRGVHRPPDRDDGVRRGGDDVRLALHQDQSVGAAPDHLCRRGGRDAVDHHGLRAAALAAVPRCSCFHAITYAVAYFGGMQFIANWTSEDIAAEAQGFAFVLQQGISIVALVGFGWLVALYGPGAWFGAAGLALTGVVLTLISLRLQPVHAAAHPH